MNTPWWQRWPWRPSGGSLQRLILVGLLVPLWALVALVATVQVVQQVRHNAAAQDAVLHRALTTWPTVLQPQAGASAMEQAPAVWFRDSSLVGESLAGSADLPRVPPSEAVQVSKSATIAWRGACSRPGYHSATMSALVPAANTESARKRWAARS